MRFKSIVIPISVIAMAMTWVPISTSAAGDQVSEKSFLDRIHPFGDMRLRYEWDGGRWSGADDRNRARARFRIGAKIDVSDELQGGFRIRTGNPDDPASPHQTFGGEFDSWDISLDRAYLKWSPNWAAGGSVAGGKMANPFKSNPVFGELVWDADINPEGGQIAYAWSQDRLSLRGTTGFWVLNLSGSETATIFPLQISAQYKASDDLKLEGAIGYYGYGNMANGGANNASAYTRCGYSAGDTSCLGNALDAGGNFRSGFKIINAFASLSYTGLPADLTLVAEYIHNSDAFSSQDTGWAIGANAKVSLMDRKHRFFYQYQDIEAEAVFAPMAQDDTQSIFSNFEGHIAGVDWALVKRVKLRTWGLFQKQIQGGNDSWNKRVRIDVNVKY